MTQQKADPVQMYEKTAKRAQAVVGAVKPGQLKQSTPCSEWDVTALVEHLANAQGSFAKTLGGLEVPAADPAAKRLSAASAAILKGVKAPGGLERKVQGRQGEVPATQQLNVATMDLAIHTWDLAKATGQDTRMDPDVVQFTYPMAEGISQRPPSKAFAAPIPAPPNASLQDKLLALTGRKP